MAEENPLNWYDWPEIIRAIKCLRSGQDFATQRAWNAATGTLDARYSLSADQQDPVIVLCDCIYLLHAPIRAQFDTVLHVHCAAEQLLARRQGLIKSKQAEAAARDRYDRFERPYFAKHHNCAAAVYVDRGF